MSSTFRPPMHPRPAQESVVALCAGHHLRDYTTLLAAAWILKLNQVPVRFVIVDAHFDLPHFDTLDTVEIRRGIPDQELLTLYQTADMLVLPLSDCTANNSLLEGMACGLPVVASDVGSIRDYLDPSAGMLVPPADPNALANAVGTLAASQTLRSTMGKAALQHVQRFSWPVVAQEIRDIYGQLC